MHKKVFIITEGGKNIGFGHITRCLGLYQAFKAKGVSPKFIVKGDQTVKAALGSVKYKRLDYVKNKERLYNLIKGSDIAIIDSYLSGANFYNEISRLVKVPVYMDDNKRLSYPAGVLINSSIYAKDLRYPVKKGIKYLLGSEYLPLRKEFWDVAPRVINKKIRKVMITFGGQKYPGFVNRITGCLEDRFNFELTILNEKNRIGTTKMRNLMLKSDLCISGGGQTTYELARCGLPNIAVSFAENQLRNLKYWHKLGFAEYIGWYKQRALLDKLKKAIHSLTDYEKRLKRSRFGQSTVDGQGARRIVKKIIQG